MLLRLNRVLLPEHSGYVVRPSGRANEVGPTGWAMWSGNECSGSCPSSHAPAQVLRPLLGFPERSGQVFGAKWLEPSGWAQALRLSGRANWLGNVVGPLVGQCGWATSGWAMWSRAKWLGNVVGPSG